MTIFSKVFIVQPISAVLGHHNGTGVRSLFRSSSRFVAFILLNFIGVESTYVSNFSYVYSHISFQTFALIYLLSLHPLVPRVISLVDN